MWVSVIRPCQATSYHHYCSFYQNLKFLAAIKKKCIEHAKFVCIRASRTGTCSGAESIKTSLPETLASKISERSNPTFDPFVCALVHRVICLRAGATLRYGLSSELVCVNKAWEKNKNKQRLCLSVRTECVSTPSSLWKQTKRQNRKLYNSWNDSTLLCYLWTCQLVYS